MTGQMEQPPVGKSGGQSTKEKPESPMKDEKTKEAETGTSAQDGAQMDGTKSPGGEEVQKGLLPQDQVQTPRSHEDEDRRGRTTEEEISSKQMTWWRFWKRAHGLVHEEYVERPSDWDRNTVKQDAEAWAERQPEGHLSGYAWGCDKVEKLPKLVAFRLFSKSMMWASDHLVKCQRLLPLVEEYLKESPVACPDCGAYMRETLHPIPEFWSARENRWKQNPNILSCAQCGKMMPLTDVDLDPDHDERMNWLHETLDNG